MKDFVLIQFDEYIKSTREKRYFKLSIETSLRKITESYYSFLAMPDKVETQVELIEKTSEVKILMQSRSSDNCAHVYNIRILNLFDTEFQLISTKLTIKKQP